MVLGDRPAALSGDAPRRPRRAARRRCRPAATSPESSRGPAPARAGATAASRVLRVAAEPLHVHLDAARLRPAESVSARPRSSAGAPHGDARTSGSLAEAPLHPARRQARGRADRHALRARRRSGGTADRARLFALSVGTREGQGAEYLLSFAQAAFADGIDTGSESGLRQVVERIGLSWNEARPFLDGEGWRAELEENRKAMLEMGLWGVPSFRLSEPSGEPDFRTWGQDRLWLVEVEIRRRLRGR
ncbi:MAG: DsbA family protein [Candidatus Binatia bacterium]